MPGGKRSNGRELAAASLAAGETVAEAARAANASERSVYGWKNDPTFAARVAEIRGEMISRAAGKLAESLDAAVKTLKDLLESDSEGIRLRAAEKLLDQAVRLAEVAELQARIEEIEAQLRRGERGPGL